MHQPEHLCPNAFIYELLKTHVRATVTVYRNLPTP